MDMRQKLRLARGNPYLILGRLYDFYFERLHRHHGSNLITEDWDNLIMLDGCRYDLLEETHAFDQEIASKQSPASQTLEFLQKTVEGRSFPETVYITANPQITKVKTEFAEIIPLWESDWDNEYQTVMPKSVVEATLRAHEEHPDKRLWVHFVQPHIPFIGETSESLSQPEFQGGVLKEGQSEDPGVWAQLERKEVDTETVWQAYKENLELVLPHAMTLIEQLSGKSVITSDHGNGFGEWGIYGHDPYRHISELTTVPWVEFEGECRTIRSTNHLRSTREIEDKATQERLRHLGYLE